MPSVVGVVQVSLSSDPVRFAPHVESFVGWGTVVARGSNDVRLGDGYVAYEPRQPKDGRVAPAPANEEVRDGIGRIVGALLLGAIVWFV